MKTEEPGMLAIGAPKGLAIPGSSFSSLRKETPRILVVDDELGMREGCRKVLSSEQFAVETAEDGNAGIDRLKKGNGFCAAIVDLKMPKMGGLEFIEQAKQLDPDLMILVITAYATIDTAVEATKRGAYGYVPKPFTPDELLLPLKNGLERRAFALETRLLKAQREKGLLEVAYERSKCRTIFSCMTDAVLVVNKDLKLVLRNASALRILPEACCHKLPTDLDALSCPALKAFLEETLTSKAAPAVLSREICLADCTYMVNASPVTEPSENVLGAVAVLRDITRLKKLEHSKSMFISMVAHEVKSPLAAIEGYLNVLLSGLAGTDKDRSQKMLVRAKTRAEGLRTLINDLLSLSAMETGHFQIKRERITLGGLLDRVVESCRENAESKSIDILYRKNPAVNRWLLLADRQASEMILLNLLDNAIKYTPEGGKVELEATTNDVCVSVKVKDNGIGMNREECQHIFEEFYRVRNRFTSNVPGTGLGLSLVKRLVKLHNGRIAVESEEGKGSTFTVSFPTV